MIRTAALALLALATFAPCIAAQPLIPPIASSTAPPPGELASKTLQPGELADFGDGSIVINSGTSGKVKVYWINVHHDGEVISLLKKVVIPASGGSNGVTISGQPTWVPVESNASGTPTDKIKIDISGPAHVDVNGDYTEVEFTSGHSTLDMNGDHCEGIGSGTSSGRFDIGTGIGNTFGGSAFAGWTQVWGL